MPLFIALKVSVTTWHICVLACATLPLRALALFAIVTGH